MSTGDGKTKQTAPPAFDPTAFAAQFAATLAAMKGSSGSSNPVVNSANATQNNDPLIYLGSENLDPNSANQHMGERDFATQPKTMNMSQAQLAWFNWSDAAKANLAKRLFALGYITSPTDIFGARDIYFSKMQDSANSLLAGKNPMTPLQILDAGAGANADTLKARALAGPGGITTTKTVDLSSRLGVQAIAETALQNALGRGPTQAELNTFYSTIRAQEEAHPSVETRTPKAGGLSTDVVTQGFSAADAQQYLLNKIREDPEYAKYQAGTTYFDAAMQANAAIGGA